MPKSLTGRLMLVSTAVVFLFLPLAGLVIEKAYTASLDNRMQEQLKIQIYSLMGLADELEPGVLWLPEALPDERLNQIASGRYAQVSNKEGAVLWRSQSTLHINLPNVQKSLLEIEANEENEPGTFHFHRILDVAIEPLHMAHVTIIWEGPRDSEHYYTFQVAENLETYFSEIDTFRGTLITWLGGLGLFLLLVNLSAMFWALKPFQKLSQSIRDVESGSIDSLETNYPRELNQIANNINALIVHEREQRSRYRNTLQDLAHSLKTPLTVLTGLASEIKPDHIKDEVQEQSERMNNLVSYQLQKAVSGGTSPIKQRVAVAPEAERLFDALTKVYHDKSLQFENLVSPDAVFFGDHNDLMEIIGNLCDNACKYGHSKVTIVSTHSTSEGNIIIDVIDDGDGVPEALRKTIFDRGERLDETVEGQGIGLAVVRDIILSYKGSIDWHDSSLGHCVRITLPGEQKKPI